MQRVISRLKEEGMPHNIRIEAPLNMRHTALFTQPQCRVLLFGYHMHDDHLDLDVLKDTSISCPSYMSSKNTLRQLIVNIGR